MSDYKISLGVSLDTSDLKTEINKVDDKYKVKLGVDLKVNDIRDRITQYNKNTNNAKLKLGVKLDTDDLKRQIKQLNLGASGDKGVDISVNTESLERSLTEVKGLITDIKNTLGTIDNAGDTKSLVASINQIATALGKATDESDTLVKSLNALSKKDLSFNFGFNMGKSASQISSEQGDLKRNAINQLKQQAKALEGYLDQYYKVAQQGEGVVKLTQGTSVFSSFWEMSPNIGNTKISLKQQVDTYKQYINLMQEAAKIKGVDLSGVTSGFSKSTEDIVKETSSATDGVEQLTQAFKGLFSSVDGEKLSAQLDSIVADLGEIRTALQGLSSGVSLEGLTSTFDRLSESIETLVKNAVLVKQTLGDSLGSSASIDTGATNKIEKASDDSTATVIQNEKKKQQAYKATADAVVYHAGVVSKLNKAETNGRFYGSNRGTGYFGTGHYFVDSATKHELDNNGYYNKMPYTSVDISQYDNLFKATTDEVADRLHTFLANLTSFTQGSGDYNVSELFAQFKNVFGDTIMDIKEFGSRLDQLKTFMLNSSLDDRSDSVSTQFMKSLGYEGVDTRGTRFADTRYGTVIYDLKEESILQANITDELQKQGQMLEKINYAKGQAFDKGEDDRIQGILDAQNKRREIESEFKNSFDTTNLDKAESDLSAAENRIREIDGIINDLQRSIDNADQEARKFAKDMEDIGLGYTDEEVADYKKRFTESYKNSIDELSQEKAELQSKIPVLEEVYNRENQLANEAYEQAKQVVEQRRLESQQAQESANVVIQNEERKQQAYRETADAAEQISKNKASDVGQFDDDTADTKELNAELKKLKDLAHQIGQLDFKIVKSDYNDEINQVREFERQLELLKKQYSETVKSLSSQGADIGSIAIPEFTEARNKIAELDAKIADTKAKLAKDIKIKLDAGDFSTQVTKINSDADKLSDVSDELKAQIKSLDTALDSMNLAKENGDIDGLISSWKEYKATLESVENQLKQLKIAENDANRDAKIEQQAKALQLKAEGLSLDMDNWLRDNSAAAEQFGDAIRELQMRLQSCGNVEFGNIKQEFQNLKKEAKTLGLTTKSVGDKLKEQFRQYSTYLGVAELFMWAEQGLRSMFEQVKLIDSAMTELKKVTDETNASYDRFLTNAASRAKEIGTTIDGLVSSTADFARLGYDFADAQGLAEVANIYAVVGDEIEGVEGATESLISTMAAFKGEMNGMSNTDFAMSIIDVFNELGNNFAISSGGIGEALERSASSLAAANNSLHESAALVTAANTVVQSPEQVGNAFKTISMRIRGAKTELEDAGLETDGMVESTAKLREEILALSGVDIMENANEFKSTYKIMDELAAKWENLTDIQQAKCLPDNVEIH